MVIQPPRKRKYTSSIPFKPINELRCEERVSALPSSYHEGMEGAEHIQVASTGHDTEYPASKTLSEDLVGLPEKSFAGVGQSGYTRDNSISTCHIEVSRSESSISY